LTVHLVDCSVHHSNAGVPDRYLDTVTDALSDASTVVDAMHEYVPVPTFTGLNSLAELSIHPHVPFTMQAIMSLVFFLSITTVSGFIATGTY